MSNIISEKFYSKSNSEHTIIYLLIVTFISRIIGSISYSNFADYNKKEAVLKNTTMIMGISSLLLILIPSYKEIGVFSIILLLVIRFIQGISIGGQIPVSISYLMENSEDKQKMSGIIFCFFAIGNAISSIIFLIIKNITTPQFLDNYGWKFPFMIGGILVFISLNLKRNNVNYSKVQPEKSQVPFIILLKNYKINLLLPILAYSFSTLITFTFFIFLPRKIIHFIPEYKNYFQLIIFTSLLTISILCYYSKNLFRINLIKILSYLFTFFLLITTFLLDINWFHKINIILILYFLVSIFSSYVYSSIYLISYNSFPKKVNCSGIGLVSGIATCFSTLVSYYIIN